jgi:NCAIR mutase (PurE)-related protein
MDKADLTQLLTQVAGGAVDVPSAVEALSRLPSEEMGYAHIDHHRSLRKGFPEVIFGQGKTAEQIGGIMSRMIAQEKIVLATRVNPEKAERVRATMPEVAYHPQARMLVWQGQTPTVTGSGTILVISAGTSDIPVAREAVVTAEAMGNVVSSLFDVGVAGIHRLLQYQAELSSAAVLIVVAGMEGALPSVVAGLVSRPVIAVPTSVGYGTSLGGLTALFGMLNSCSSNVAVVNIDNGFGAAYLASSITHLHLP